jgi:prepilin-type N-terminal cleavage/methylation domain-containing protein
MLKSVICLNSRGYPLKSRPTGFTLLELIVVLVLLGVVIVLAVPNLNTLYGSISRTTERDYILDQLASLGHRAWTSETNLVVFSTRERAEGGADSQSYNSAEAAGRYPSVRNIELFENFQEYPVDVPSGWTLQLDTPLRARSTGVCLGTALTLIHRSGASYQRKLVAPYCHAQS